MQHVIFSALFAVFGNLVKKKKKRKKEKKKNPVSKGFTSYNIHVCPDLGSAFQTPGAYLMSLASSN